MEQFFFPVGKGISEKELCKLQTCMHELRMARATSCVQIRNHLSTPDRRALCQTHPTSLPSSSPQGSHKLVVRQLRGEKGGSAHAIFSHFRDHSFRKIKKNIDILQINIDLYVDMGRNTDIQFYNYRTSLRSSVSQFLLRTSQSTQKILPSLVTPVIYSCMFAHSLFKNLNSRHMTNEFFSNLCAILV